MYSFSREALSYLLEYNINEKKDHPKSEYSNSGPAQQDRNLSFYTNETECFLQPQSTSTSPTSRKKIIVSNGLFGSRSPTGLELIVMNDLIEHYDVILWEGPHQDITRCQPVHHPTEFWKKRVSLYPATEQAVKDALAKQGHTSQEYTILDYHAYNQFLWRCGKEFNDKMDDVLSPPRYHFLSNHINLATEPVSHLDQLLKSVDASKIKTIQVDFISPSEIDFIVKYFSHVELLIQYTHTSEMRIWWESNASRFRNCSIRLNSHIPVPILRIPNEGPKKIIINNVRRLEKVVIENPSQCNIELNFIKCRGELDVIGSGLNFIPYLKFDSDCPALRKYFNRPSDHIRISYEVERYTPMSFKPRKCTINNEKDLKDALLDKSIFEAEELHINNEIDKEEEEPKIKSTYETKLPNHVFTKTRVLRINGCRDPRKIVAQFPHLAILFMDSCDMLAFNKGDFSSIMHLVVKKASDLNPVYLDQQFPNLQTFYIHVDTPKKRYREFHVGNSTHLKIGSLHDKEDMAIDSLDLSKATALEYCDIDILEANTINCENLRLLKSAEIRCRNTMNRLNLHGASDLRKLAIDFTNDLDLALDDCNELRDIRVEARKTENKETLNIISKNQLPALRKVILRAGELKYNESIFPKDCVKKITRTTQSNAKKDSIIESTKTDYSDTKKDSIKESTETTRSHVKHDKEQVVKTNSETLKLDKELEAKNDRSPVSRFSLRKKSSVTINREDKNREHKALGTLKVTLMGHGQGDKTHYRIETADRIRLEKSELIYDSDLEKNCQIIKDKNAIKLYSNSTISLLNHSIQKNNNEVLGLYEVEGQLEKDQYYSLPTQEPINRSDMFNVYCDPLNAVDLFWNENHQQYYFKITQHTPPNLKILYHYQKRHEYEPDSKARLILKKNTELLSKELIQALDKIVDKPGLEFLKDKDPDHLLANLEKLKKYCASFEDKTPLIQNSHPSSLDILLASLIQKCGVCAQRSQAFMMLAHYMGIPAQMITNEAHAFNLVPYEKGWSRVDSGGAIFHDKTQLNAREDTLHKLIQSAPKVVSSDLPIALVYRERFEKSLKKEELKPNLFKDVIAKHPLIELNENQSPLDIYPKMAAEIGTKDYFYIHSPDDFNAYLFPFKQEKGIRKETDGPIAKILKNGGTLIVNWSNFTPTQIVTYQSILDKKPTLGRSVFSETNLVNVIGLIRPETQCCSAFKSRSKQYSLPSHYPFKSDDKKLAKDDKAKAKVESIVVDLFGRSNWRDHFIQDVLYRGNKVELKDRPLLEALRPENPRPIHVLNPPNDPKFKVLLHRINSERRYFHNGEYINVPPDVIITCGEKSHEETWKRLKDKVVQIARYDEKSDKTRRRIYLGLHNLHECYESTIVDEKKQARTEEKGYFDFSKPNDTEFYVSGYVPRSEWDILLDKMNTLNKSNPDKTFRFVLAPGAQIQGIDEAMVQPKQNHASRVILSNDSDFEVLKLVNDAKNTNSSGKPLVIHVTPQMSFENLITKLSIEQKPNQVNFMYEEKGLLTALRQGRNVILSGALSPRLYQQLLPYFNDNAEIYNNGQQEKKLSGKLFSVMPNGVKSSLPLVEYQSRQNHLQDYKNEFKAADQKYVELIDRYYQYARKLSHRGVGYPKPPELNHARLANMVNALKHSELHKRNPIKSTLLFDYKRSEDLNDKANEDYAYLNVIAKYQFRPNDTTPVRQSKLNKLHKHIEMLSPDERKAYVWQILNCYSGQALKAILGNDLSLIFKPQSSTPILTDALITKVFTQLLIPKDVKAEPTSRIKKQTSQLGRLLKESRLVMLKGEPGVGKTYAVNQLKKQGISCFDADKEGIKSWMDAKSDNDIVLLVDEANMAKPGTWDALKALFVPGDGSIYHDGQFYTSKLTPRHKVIFTGNPENFPGRHFHQLIQDYGRVLYIKKPSTTDLKTILGHEMKLYPETLSDKLIKVFFLIKKYNPTFVYSNRDLLSAAKRFTHIVKEEGSKNLEEKLCRACAGEFSGTLHDMNERKHFISELEREFGLVVSDHKSQDDLIEIKTNKETYLVPREAEYVINAIEQDLKIREHEVLLQKDSKDDKGYRKQITLIEGDPGLGKSTNYRIVLEKNGYDEKHVDPKKRFVEINAGDRNAHVALEKAFQSGSVVILNELNLDESLEKVLITYLERANESPGFHVFASQNSSAEAGRASVSSAIRNRVHLIYMDAFSRPSLIAMATRHGLDSPDIFVDEFIKSKATMRTFYHEINKQKLLHSVPDKAYQDSKAMLFVNNPSATPAPSLAPHQIDHKKSPF